MEIIIVREVTIGEVDQLMDIGIQTFTETYSSVNTEENMEAYLKDKFSVERIRAELSNKESVFFFAEFEEKVIGYLKINLEQAQTDLKGNDTLEIERIYVLKKFQGKRVGQKLYQKAIEVARQTQVNYIWLGVWEENTRAISFYEKHKFVAFDRHIFKLGDDEQKDILMRLEMKGK
jgi:ribosomal protein S18 acetylase RimI-like enzyme